MPERRAKLSTSGRMRAERAHAGVHCDAGGDMEGGGDGDGLGDDLIRLMA